MPPARTLRLYLDAPTLDRVRTGQHNFFRRLMGAVAGQGWRVELRENTLAERLAAPERRGHALFHMEQPTHPGALTCRRAHIGAFWRIEAVAERWDWPIARAVFDPDTIDPQVARAFGDRLRNRLYPGEIRDEGFIFMPLQGLLTQQRGFQSASPIAMLETALAQTDLPVRATLHPRESYSAADLRALDDLTARHPRLTVQRGGSHDLLRACRMVVTQNSSLALEGFVLHKPAVLFAQIDFHHIAGSVPRDGIAAAFGASKPDFDRYLYWFLHQTAINAARPECEDQILQALRRHGWQI